MKVIYKLGDTNFYSRIFSGTILVTTDAPTDTIEQKRLLVGFRVINAGYNYVAPVSVVLIGSLLVIFISIRKSKNKSISKDIREFVSLK